ncbi:MAG: hypothetical protein RRA94_07850 [Bacteroidota bacterium]|nr:hypothetical protein [Bacteroidota bacterium]
MKTIVLSMLTLLLCAACSSVDLNTVVDTQFLLANRTLPLQSLLVVYDTRDLAAKDEFEGALASHLRESSDATVYRDIDLYSPLKNMSDKEKLWALKDEGIDGILYLSGGPGERSMRDWLYPEAADIDRNTPAWQTGTIKLFLPNSGQVIWVGSVKDYGSVVYDDLNSRGFFSAVSSDLLRRGILDEKRDPNPGLRGFNR